MLQNFIQGYRIEMKTIARNIDGRLQRIAIIEIFHNDSRHIYGLKIKYSIDIEIKFR